MPSVALRQAPRLRPRLANPAASTRIDRGWLWWSLGFMVWPAATLALVACKLVSRGLARSARETLIAFGIVAVSVVPTHPLSDQSIVSAIGRGVLDASYSLPAIAWGLGHGGSLEVSGGTFVVTGMHGGHGPLNAVTIGDTLLTRLQYVSPPVLDHETDHANQWAALGSLMVPLYGLAEWIAGGDPTKNVFEVQAGLVEGDYCQPGMPCVGNVPSAPTASLSPLATSPQNGQ